MNAQENGSEKYLTTEEMIAILPIGGIAQIANLSEVNPIVGDVDGWPEFDNPYCVTRRDDEIIYWMKGKQLPMKLPPYDASKYVDLRLWKIKYPA